MPESFMANATEVLMAYMRETKARPTFALGQLSIGLEIVSLIRTLESFPVVSVAEKEGTIACLHTLLREQGLENAYEAYEMLAEWRKPKFRAVNVSASQIAREQLAIDVSYVRQRAGLTVSADAASSAREALDSARALEDSTRAPGWERPSPEQDDAPRDVQLELLAEVRRERRCE